MPPHNSALNILNIIELVLDIADEIGKFLKFIGKEIKVVMVSDCCVTVPDLATCSYVILM